MAVDFKTLCDGEQRRFLDELYEKLGRGMARMRWKLESDGDWEPEFTALAFRYYGSKEPPKSMLSDSIDVELNMNLIFRRGDYMVLIDGKYCPVKNRASIIDLADAVAAKINRGFKKAHESA